MCNITDECFVFPLIIKFLFCVIFQTLTHLLKRNTKFTDLIIRFHIHGKIQVAFFNILRCNLQLFNWGDHAAVYPNDHHKSRQKQNNDNRDNPTYNCLPYFRHGSLQGSNDKGSCLFPCSQFKIYLFYQNLIIAVNISSYSRLGSC